MTHSSLLGPADSLRPRRDRLPHPRRHRRRRRPRHAAARWRRPPAAAPEAAAGGGGKSDIGGQAGAPARGAGGQAGAATTGQGGAAGARGWPGAAPASGASVVHAGRSRPAARAGGRQRRRRGGRRAPRRGAGQGTRTASGASLRQVASAPRARARRSASAWTETTDGAGQARRVSAATAAVGYDGAKRRLRATQPPTTVRCQADDPGVDFTDLPSPVGDLQHQPGDYDCSSCSIATNPAGNRAWTARPIAACSVTGDPTPESCADFGHAWTVCRRRSAKTPNLLIVCWWRRSQATSGAVNARGWLALAQGVFGDADERDVHRSGRGTAGKGERNATDWLPSRTPGPEACCSTAG